MAYDIERMREDGLSDDEISQITGEPVAPADSPIGSFDVEQMIKDEVPADKIEAITGASTEQEYKYLKDVAMQEGAIKPEEVMGIVGEEPKISKMEEFGNDIKQAYMTGEKYLQAYESGKKRLPLGMLRIVQDVQNYLEEQIKGIELSDEDKASYAKELIEENEEFSQRIQKELGFDKDDIITPANAGQVAAEVAALAFPLAKAGAVKGVVETGKMLGKAGAVEGAVAGTAEYGAGKTAGEATTTAGIAAGMTIAGVPVLEHVVVPVVGKVVKDAAELIKGDKAIWQNLVLGRSSDKQAYDFVVEKTGSTADDVVRYTEDYANAIGKNVDELTYADKINAVVTNSDVGGSVKTAAQRFEPTTLARDKAYEQELLKTIKESTQGADLDNPALQLDYRINQAGKNFGEVKDILLTHYNDKITIPTKEVDSLVKNLEKSILSETDRTKADTIIKILRDSAEDGISVEDLIPLKQSLNSMNLTGTKAWKAGKVGEFIDEKIKKSVGDDGYTLWKEVNKDYAYQALVKDDNDFAKKLIKYANQDLSRGQIVEELLKSGEKGYNRFNQLKNILGEEASTRFEKGLIQGIMKNDAKSMMGRMEDISKFDFATVEGRSIAKEVDRIKGAISKEDASTLLNKIFGLESIQNTGWSDNLINKAKYSLVGKVYNALRRRGVTAADDERSLHTIAKVIKENKNKISLDVKTDKEFQKAFEQERKALDAKITELRNKGAAKTAQDNKELIQSIRSKKTIDTVTKTKKENPWLLEKPIRSKKVDKIDKDIVQKYVGDAKTRTKADDEALSSQLDSVEGTYTGTAIRGMGDDKGGKLVSLEVGDDYIPEGVTSIAKDVNTAERFLKMSDKPEKVMIKFRNFKNKPIDVKNQLGFSDVMEGKSGYNFIEDEVLIPKGRKFEVIRKTKGDDGVTYLEVRER